eukprot:scaffold196145_cov29-Prasinocladus_malaysianus.AAC.1
MSIIALHAPMETAKCNEKGGEDEDKPAWSELSGRENASENTLKKDGKQHSSQTAVRVTPKS